MTSVNVASYCFRTKLRSAPFVKLSVFRASRNAAGAIGGCSRVKPPVACQRMITHAYALCFTCTTAIIRPLRVCVSLSVATAKPKAKPSLGLSEG